MILLSEGFFTGKGGFGDPEVGMLIASCC